MLEALVSSRIRRTLLEYLVSRPAERFYLRGLAKELDLSVSPLRRELKRLERSGMLQASHEGNMLFYTVDAASPAFHQLQQLGAEPSLEPAPVAAAAPFAGLLGTEPAAPAGAVWRNAGLAAAAVAGLALMVVAVDRTLKGMTDRHLTTVAMDVLRPAEPAAAGTMRGQRWRITPGALGGFGAGGQGGGQ
jgi:hypothetical protein